MTQLTNKLPSTPKSMTKNLNIIYLIVSIQYNHEKHQKLLRA